MKKPPLLRRHKPSNRAYVWYDGRRVYLGKWGAPETLERYRRFLLELETHGVVITSETPITVAEIFARFLDDHASYYVRAESLGRFKASAGYVCALFGATPAKEFGPLALRAVRDSMQSTRNINRNTINQYCGAVVQVFKYAASIELIDASVYHALQTVEPLRRGHCDAPEGAPRRPVDPSTVDATADAAAPCIAAIIRLLRLTGMRPSECLKMRPCDLSRDAASGLLIYTLESDKTALKRAVDDKRVIYLGARCERILAPFLTFNDNQNGYIFTRGLLAQEKAFDPANPTKARRGRRARKPDKASDFIPCGLLYKEIQKAANLAGVTRWNAYQLRHLYASEIRKQYGLEVAQVMLGHKHADVTQIYAERDYTRAREVAKEKG